MMMMMMMMMLMMLMKQIVKIDDEQLGIIMIYNNIYIYIMISECVVKVLLMMYVVVSVSGDFC